MSRTLQLPILLIVISFLAASCNRQATPTVTTPPTQQQPDAPLTAELRATMTPDMVLQAFKDGNERFLSGNLRYRRLVTEVEGTAMGQTPYAIVLSCIDSRVPVETIFDKRIGEIFSARLAGNVVNEDVIGGMEFSTNFAGAKLIMVMGHTKCGAVQGAAAGVEYGNLTALLNKIDPVKERVDQRYDGEPDPSDYRYVDELAAENVRYAISQIRDNSPDLVRMEQEGRIKIVGSMYEIETGRVVFFD